MDRVCETHLLRRSYRAAGRVKTETPGNISRLPPELVRRGLAGEPFLLAGELEIRRSVRHGHVAAVFGSLRAPRLERLTEGAPEPGVRPRGRRAVSASAMRPAGCGSFGLPRIVDSP